MVKEKCPCSCSGVWKLPTGYINKVIHFSALNCFLVIVLNSEILGNISLKGQIKEECFILAYLQSEDIYAGAIREVKEETGVTKYIQLPKNY